MDLDEYTKHRVFADVVYPQTDEYGQTILELAVERNYVEVVELILDVHNPAYQNYWIGDDFISLMPLIYKGMDKEYKNIVKLLTEKYEAGAKLYTRLKNQASLISAIKSRKTGTKLFFLFEFTYYLVT